MHLKRRLFVCFASVMLCASLQAQQKEDLAPFSFKISSRLLKSAEVRFFKFDESLLKTLDERTDKNGHMPRFGRTILADINPKNSGSWTSLPNGDKIWRIELKSPGAKALIPCFNQFFLPAGALLHFYSPDRKEVLGAFTSANNPDNGCFNPGLIHGSSCFIEYYEPHSVEGQGNLNMNELGHAYRLIPERKQTEDFGNAGQCEVNVNCPEGFAWNSEKNAIVRILVKVGADLGWCSGELVNNARQDCTPYLLSADHCYQDEQNNWALPSDSDLSKWVFYFQFESPTCANPTGQGTLGNKTITGCRFVSASLDDGGSLGSDFALLRLSSTPPQSYIPFYAGWSNYDVAALNGVGVHHPEADIKKVSTYYTQLVSSSFAGTVADTHWEVTWEPTQNGHGVTEPGSSGSPIFDQNHHIVGTLTGGSSTCYTPYDVDLYGKFSYHWAGNGTADTLNLKHWLDPDSTGIHVLDGQYGPCTPVVSLDAAINIIRTTGTYCTSEIAVTCVLTNYGSDTLTSDSLNFAIDGISNLIEWTGHLAPLQSANVSLPLQNFSVGTHTVLVSSSMPNGGIDGNPYNDSKNSSFMVTTSAGEYLFSLQTGDEGSTISWELTDAYNNLYYTGGPYPDSSAGEQINLHWCLPQNCYIFTIFSSTGNGLQGSVLPGTFSIRDSAGSLVDTLLNNGFGNSDSFIFCRGIHLEVTNANDATNISVVPNPGFGKFRISPVPEGSLLVTDALGRKVFESKLSESASFLIDLEGRESGIYFFQFTTNNGIFTRKVVLKSSY